jgi:hypothetical protein
MAVIYVIKHSVTEVTGGYINVYTMGSVHMAVMCVIKDSGK